VADFAATSGTEISLALIACAGAAGAANKATVTTTGGLLPGCVTAGALGDSGKQVSVTPVGSDAGCF